MPSHFHMSIYLHSHFLRSCHSITRSPTSPFPLHVVLHLSLCRRAWISSSIHPCCYIVKRVWSLWTTVEAETSADHRCTTPSFPQSSPFSLFDTEYLFVNSTIIRTGRRLSLPFFVSIAHWVRRLFVPGNAVHIQSLLPSLAVTGPEKESIGQTWWHLLLVATGQRHDW